MNKLLKVLIILLIGVNGGFVLNSVAESLSGTYMMQNPIDAVLMLVGSIWVLYILWKCFNYVYTDATSGQENIIIESKTETAQAKE